MSRDKISVTSVTTTLTKKHGKSCSFPCENHILFYMWNSCFHIELSISHVKPYFPMYSITFHIWNCIFTCEKHSLENHICCFPCKNLICRFTCKKTPRVKISLSHVKITFEWNWKQNRLKGIDRKTIFFYVRAN